MANYSALPNERIEPQRDRKCMSSHKGIHVQSSECMYFGFLNMNITPKRNFIHCLPLPQRKGASCFATLPKALVRSPHAVPQTYLHISVWCTVGRKWKTWLLTAKLCSNRKGSNTTPSLTGNVRRSSSLWLAGIEEGEKAWTFPLASAVR